MSNIKTLIDRLQQENNELSDMAGDACGEALLFRRTLEWIAYKSGSGVEARELALRTLKVAGYLEPTDELQMAPIL